MPLFFLENNRNNLKKLEAQAMQNILHGDASLDTNAELIFHITMNPWFDLPKGWTVFYPPSEKPRQVSHHDSIPQVQRIIWDKHQDIERAGRQLPSQFEPTPTLNTALMQLNREQFDSLIEEGSRIMIPMVGLIVPVGLDGTRYTLRTENFSTRFTLNWWSNGPETWQPFTAWVFRLIRFLDEAINTEYPQTSI